MHVIVVILVDDTVIKAWIEDEKDVIVTGGFQRTSK